MLSTIKMRIMAEVNDYQSQIECHQSQIECQRVVHASLIIPRSQRKTLIIQLCLLKAKIQFRMLKNGNDSKMGVFCSVPFFRRFLRETKVPVPLLVTEVIPMSTNSSAIGLISLHLRSHHLLHTCTFLCFCLIFLSVLSDNLA